jgi:Zn-dependent protease with chaperone function
MFYSYVSQYNAGKTVDEKICLSPLFLASRTGKVCIILLAILGIAAIIFQFLLAGKLALSSLMSFSIFLQLIIRRENYKKTYKNIMNLDDDIHETNSN